MYQKDLERFTVHPYRSKRLDDYFTRMSRDNVKVLWDPHVASVLQAQGFSVEESPRSVYKVEKLFEALSFFAPRKAPRIEPDRHYRSGISLAYAAFGYKPHLEKLHVLPFTAETVATITSNPSGSPGITNYGCTKAQSMERALARGLQTLKKEKAPEPCLGFKRTQFNDKTRLVWGFPYSMTAVEGLLARPLIDLFKQANTPMAFGMTTGHLGTKLRVASYQYEWAYSLDMSRFDATIAAELIRSAFRILHTWFDLDEVEPYSGRTVREIFDVVEHYFIYTPIVMPDKKIYKGKDHGVPSGSYFTQIIDSIVNTIIAGTLSSRFNLGVSKDALFVLGDDLLFWSNRRMSLDVIASYAKEKLGVLVHGSEKSELYHYDEVIHYLGRDWDNGLPTLAQEEVLKRIFYPENYRHYPDEADEILRQVRMMLLSYASTYRSAWELAYVACEPNPSNVKRGCANTDVNTYSRTRDNKVDPNCFSGLMRFKYLYFGGEPPGDIPITALQYWL